MTINWYIDTAICIDVLYLHNNAFDVRQSSKTVTVDAVKAMVTYYGNILI